MTTYKNLLYVTPELQTFGRRRARKPTNRQQMLVRNVLPRCQVNTLGPNSSEIKAAFDDENTQVWLEIGFGGGEHLIWQAIKNPQVEIIGCDPFIDGTIKVLDFIEGHNNKNIRLYNDDVRQLLRFFPQQYLSRVFVLFPDPWPKKKHNKRRLLNIATLKLISSAMRPGAELRIATDVNDYARAILIAIRDVKCLFWTAIRSDDWRMRPSDWPETRYERKAKKAGRNCYYFSFVKSPALQRANWSK